MRNKAALLIFFSALLFSPFAHAVTNGAATQEAKAFVIAMSKGDFVSPQKEFTASMKQAAGPKKLASIWSSKTRALGHFEGIGKTKVIDYQSYKIVFVKVQFKTSPIWTKVPVDNTGHIAGLFFIPTAGSQ